MNFRDVALPRRFCAIWLHEEHFFGAETFFGDEATIVQNWLDDALPFDLLATTHGHRGELLSLRGD